VNTYSELLWFRLLQAYDFEENKRNENELILGERFERRPWKDLEGELRFYPWTYVTLTSRTFYSYYDHQINRHDHTLTLTAPTYGAFSTGVDFRSNLEKNREYAGTGLTDLNVWKNKLTINFFNPINLEAYYEYDFEKKEDYEQSYSLIYNHQCFRLIFKAKFTPFDDSYKVYLELPGLTF